MEEEKRFEPDDPEQSARFIETATLIQADDAAERFEEAMRRIAAAKPTKPKKGSRKPHEPREALEE